MLTLGEMMPKGEFDKPIPCPHCGLLLDTVQVEKVIILEWQEEDDLGISLNEFVESGQGGTTIKCYKCGREIGASSANGSWGIYPKSEDY
jgi:hypothetical protein